MKSFRTFCEELDYKEGDSVYVKHPTDAAKTLTGKVTKIHSNDRVSIQHRDGTTKTYHTKDASQEFGKLNKNPYERPEFK
jgi:hypothetical protein